MIVFAVLVTLASLALPRALSGITERFSAVQEARAFPVIADREGFVRVSRTSPPEVSAAAASVFDSTTAEFLYEKNGTGVFPIASLTKLMTALVALERGIDLDASETITAADNDPEGAFVTLPVGSVVTVHDLLDATLVASGNNAAEALARAAGIEESAFVAAMNARAAELGLAATRFTDVTGLGLSNVSSVRDMALLTSHALQRKEIRDATQRNASTITLQPSGRTIAFRSTNELLGLGLRITGGKTGTHATGAVLTLGVEDEQGHGMIVTVFGSGRSARFLDARALAEWALETFQHSS